MKKGWSGKGRWWFIETGPYYLLPDDALKSVTIIPGSWGNIAAENPVPFLLVYPNPARNYIIVEYNIEEVSASAIFTVYSPEGKVKSKHELARQQHSFIINTRDWQAGIYFFKFTSANNRIQSGKILITK